MNTSRVHAVNVDSLASSNLEVQHQQKSKIASFEQTSHLYTSPEAWKIGVLMRCYCKHSQVKGGKKQQELAQKEEE